MVLSLISEIDLSNLTAVHFRTLLESKFNTNEQADIILNEFANMIMDGWSTSYARKCLKIDSTIIPCMRIVRRNPYYKKICSDYQKRSQKLKNQKKSQLSQPTDLSFKGMKNAKQNT